MKKSLLLKLPILVLLLLAQLGISQNSLTVFDQILFYDGYAGLVAEADLYEPIPPEVLRHSNSNYAIKLTDSQLDAVGNKMTAEITLKAACDNYDRIANVYLAFVPKGETTYNSADVDRIEIGRYITPFMNKNRAPMEVPYAFTIDNVAEIFHDQNLRANFDIWVELAVFGVPYAAQTEVAGCAGRIDTFHGTLTFNSEEDSGQTYPNSDFVKTLSCNEYLNNYNGTDVPGETTKIINFDLPETVENVTLYLITSNHGANAGGEEYERREHFLYLDDNLVYQYIPGGKSCEPYRQYNTQSNGIYQGSPQSTRRWLSFSNWCPGDVIPNREVNLGTLSAGQHTIKLDVPDAVFAAGEGYIPVSMYLQNRDSYQPMCTDPTNFEAINIASTNVDLDWDENGTAENWEILYGRAPFPNEEDIVDANNNGDTGATVSNLLDSTFYNFFVRSKCDNGLTSNWVGPLRERTPLGLNDNAFSSFEYYPNPVNNNLLLKASNTIDAIAIFDAFGKKILSKNINSPSSEIDLSAISSGIYFMKVRIGETTNSFKLIKE